MRIFLTIILALVAFAANSILVRIALASGQIGPGAFTAIRLGAGAITLLALAMLRGEALFMKGFAGSGVALLVYAVGFSFAYMSLDTGTGALILFGGVQVTMFGGALVAGERPSMARWLGAALALSGLALLFGPKAGRPDILGAALMAGAAIGWGVYSLRGRGVALPIAATASTFLLATPFAALIWLVFPSPIPILVPGVYLAIASGALASGLGYAIWYSVLPMIKSSTAAIVQLSVPVIAMLGGVLLLSEPFSMAFALAAPLILAGVLIALWSPKNR